MSSKQTATLEPDAPAGKENAQFIYSLILIFIIPASLIISTLWNIQKLQKNIEADFGKKIELAKSVFSGAVSDSLDDPADLQKKIQTIQQNQTELEEITVLKQNEDGFQAIASSKADSVGLTYKSLQYTSSWLEDKTLTTPTNKDETTQKRAWVIISPLKNTQNEKAALLHMKMSTADIDQLTQKTLIESLIILGLTIFFVLLLLFNHFRFFEYALLVKRLKEVDKMKDDFINMASHELKTPMAAIKGYLAMIFEGVAGKVDKKAREHLEIIFANIKRLDSLVDALLDVSRLEQKRIQFDMQAIDVTEVLKQVLAELQGQAEEKKLKFEYEELPRPHPLIFADPDRLTQVFNNVIGNAIKYTFKGGVYIYHRFEDNRLKIMVKDTGIGMSKQDMKGLFGKFYRIRTEKTADIPGTGLGLWITKEIVLRMNGEIYAESKEGIGSIFTMIFPIIRENQKWKKPFIFFFFSILWF